ncbi:hypothetical protein QUB70_24360 [Microcoleus sp. A003_D6]
MGLVAVDRALRFFIGRSQQERGRVRLHKCFLLKRNFPWSRSAIGEAFELYFIHKTGAIAASAQALWY